MRALIELGKSGAQNVMYRAMSTLVTLTNIYNKQEINPQMLEPAKFAKHYIPRTLTRSPRPRSWTNSPRPRSWTTATAMASTTATTTYTL